MPAAPRLSPSPTTTLSRVRARSSRRVLDATRSFVERRGLEQLSMRRLAEEADVSVRTIYNLFGDKNGLIRALAHESLDAIDVAVDDIAATDPIERIWEAVTISIDATVRYVPKAVVAAVVSDPAAYRELARRWRGRDLTLEAIRAATRAGALRDDLSPELLVEQAGTVFLHLLGRWAAGELDDDALRAGVLRAFDVCLLAVAVPPTRTQAQTRTRARLLAHATSLDDDHDDHEVEVR